MANLPKIEGYIESIKIDITILTLILGVITVVLSAIIIFREITSYKMQKKQEIYIDELQNKTINDLKNISSSIDSQIIIALAKKNNELIDSFNEIAKSKLDRLETKFANNMFYMYDFSLEIAMMKTDIDDNKMHRTLLQLMRSSYKENEIIEVITDLSYFKGLFKEIDYKQDKFEKYVKSLPHMTIAKKEDRVNSKIKNIIHEINERKET
jgi:hypothetical protein